MYTSAMIRDLPVNNNNEKKQHFLQHKERHKNTKEAYTDWSKSMGKKVAFAMVFTDNSNWRALSEEASIHTTEITAIKEALKELHKREDIRLMIYKDSQSSLQSIEYDKKITKYKTRYIIF